MKSDNLDITFSEDQALIMDASREFCREKSDMETVRNLLKSKLGFSQEVWSEMVELGWTGITVPEKYGGSNLGLEVLVTVAESMGRYLLTAPLVSSALAAQALIRNGNTQQQDKWLPLIVEGKIGVLALLDNEDFGSDIHLSARDKGDKVHLSGKKFLVVDANAADFFIVSAIYEGQEAMIIVDAEQVDSQAIDEKILIDETKRASDIDFTGTTVEKGAVLANATSTLRDLELVGALLYAAEATGSCAAALDTIVEYLTTRTQFGRLIGAYQALKHPTADILMQMDSSRSLVYHAATLVNNADITEDAEVACRMAKAQSSEALLFAGDRAVQFHGGMGFTYECNAQLFIRRAQMSQHIFGDAQHHRFHLASLLLDS